jgi:tRNA A37 N6-isopentenylltransferase MiaA
MYLARGIGVRMFTTEVTQGGHIKRVTVTRSDAGWALREERDSEVVRTVNYMDWHRVERAIEVFKLNGSPAEARGEPASAQSTKR